ncbi:hypothetical protein GCM10029976_066810 [Kribbella albertanoniae]|uniref:Uncharacterized protein n=1 Tax=Kribbella albertanoniae TaxID=1266829 RepID=A0A4V2XT12_9ACTN|nr:hypothetical protein [Kribbella albertanoniae]TDC35795.1 hypothetical protein E1261_00255 [Kribbella albertanoniae]
MSEPSRMTGIQKHYLAVLSSVVGEDGMIGAYGRAAVSHVLKGAPEHCWLFAATARLSYSEAEMLIAELRSQIYTSSAAGETPPFVPHDLEAVRRGLALGWWDPDPDVPTHLRDQSDRLSWWSAAVNSKQTELPELVAVCQGHALGWWHPDPDVATNLRDQSDRLSWWSAAINSKQADSPELVPLDDWRLAQRLAMIDGEVGQDELTALGSLGWVSFADPMRELAGLLRVPYRPRPHWWSVYLVLSLLPAGVLIVLSLLTTGVLQGVLLTLAGAMAGIQLAAPYVKAVRFVATQLGGLAESERKVWRSLATYSRFVFGHERYVGSAPIGHRHVALPLERARYRRRFRQWTKYFRPMSSRVLVRGRLPGMVAVLSPSPRLIPQSLWNARQRRVLRLVGRDLIRASGNRNEDACVRTLADQLGLPYAAPRVRRRYLTDMTPTGASESIRQVGEVLRKRRGNAAPSR